MPDYKTICHHLIISLAEIIDCAKDALENAEENIIADEANVNNLRLFRKPADAGTNDRPPEK